MEIRMIVKCIENLTTSNETNRFIVDGYYEIIKTDDGFKLGKEIISEDTFKKHFELLEMNAEHEQKIMNIKGEDVSIDINCIPLVQFFNDNKLDTKFCCEGDDINNFNIMFQDYITDKDVENFILKYRNKYNHSPFLGNFHKWCRVMSGEIKYNWIYLAKNKQSAIRDYIKVFNNSEKVKEWNKCLKGAI